MSAATPLFDSRKLDGSALFSCQLPVGSYALSADGAPTLQGQIVVTEATQKYSPSTNITVTADPQGNLTLRTPSAVTAPANAFIAFDFYADSANPIFYSLQVSGPNGSIDSRTLADGQVFAYPLTAAGDVTYEGYLLVTGTGGQPSQYVLKQRGILQVRNTVPIGNPVVIALD